MWPQKTWMEFKDVLRNTVDFIQYIHWVEGANIPLGQALERYSEVREKYVKLADDLPEKPSKKLKDFGEKRDAMFFHTWAMSSNVLHPSYRGMALGVEKRRQIVAFLVCEGWTKLMGPTPPPSAHSGVALKILFVKTKPLPKIFSTL